MLINAINLFNFNSQNFQKSKINQNNNYHTNLLQQTSAYDSVSFTGKTPMKELQKLYNKYSPKIMNFGEYSLPVHNNGIGKKLQQEYTLKSFQSLFKYANKNGVFDFNINPKTHYVQTSLISASENPLMSKLVWVTDSSNVMPILKKKNPEICVPLLENVSSFYAKQERNFNKIINDPDLFELNHDYPNTAKNGVGHVFNPNNKVTHKWFARTRLDSLGLYLKTASDLIYDGLSGSKYGYKSANKISQNTVESYANVTRYLQKLNYAYTKDTGPWEEKTFNATTTSDVAIINNAFRKMLKLVYEPTDNKEILKFRERLLKAKNGEVFKNEKTLREQLAIGEHRIKTNSREEVPNERVFDGAMSFIYKTEKIDNDPIQNAHKVIKRLMLLEKGNVKSPEIVRDNGIIRYVKDTYLHINSDITGVKAEYMPKTKFPEKTEAQWFMVSDVSTSYGKVAQSLLDKIEKDGKTSPEIDRLLKFSLKKETEYINRSYARITGKNSYKANGVKAPEFQIPEAYQAVVDGNGVTKFVPGSHTPLAWAQASSFEASELFMQNLARFEKLGKV